MRALTFTQLHEGKPCLLTQPCLPPHPEREGGRGRALWRAGGGSSPGQHSKAQPSRLHLQAASRRNGDLPHKEQVWNQPADSYPWQTQERKWQELRTKVVFIICEGMSMGNYGGCGCGTPPFQWGPMVSFQLHSLGLCLHGPASRYTSCSGRALHRTSKSHLVLTTCTKKSSEDRGDTQLHLQRGYAPLRTRCGESRRAGIRDSNKTNPASSTDPVQSTLQEKHSQNLQAG